MIAAAVLPLLALIFVVRMLFFGSTGPTRTNANNSNARRAANANTQRTNPAAPDVPKEVATVPTEIVFNRVRFGGGGTGRNIFAYYIPPAPRPSVKVEPTLPPATPTPPPPIALGGVAPASVYARTNGFTMQLSGDKFTPESRVYLDGQEVPTQFRSPQQLTATVPASALSAPGTRTVAVRTPDGALFSNNASLNVMQPPAPTSTYVGRITRPRGDTALLKNQKGELEGKQIGDIVDARFRVASITANAVELVDKDLNVRHTLPYIETRTPGGPGGRVPGSIQPPPPPKPEDGDDEP